MARYGSLIPASRLEVNGQEAPWLADSILEIAVTLQLNSVDEISITLAGLDPDRLGGLNADLDSLALGDKLGVWLGYNDALDHMADGEITAIEAAFSEEGEPTLRVLGHSPLYNLLRERRTRTFVKVKDSDIVQKIAGDNGLSVQADDTEITHDYVIQANRTDLDFILERAAAVNFDLWYESGSVIFRPARTFETEIGSLAWTETLLSFTPRLDGRAGIHRVTVRGYDPEKKDAVTGSWTGGKGDSAETLVDPTVSTVAEADQLAKAIGEEVQARRVTGSASTVGDTRIMPGRAIDLRGVGRRFSGRYKIARATHRIGAAGYLTEFDVQGEGP